MKRFILITTILLTTLFVNAQKNEVKLDVFDALVLNTFDVSYERAFNENMSYGTSLFINFKKKESYYEKFAVTPFYRFYFFQNESFGMKGYFVEGFSKIAFGDSYIFQENQETSNYFDIALGVSIGRKWIHKNNFVFETNFGVGRNLGLSNASPDFAVRFGIGLGYRF